MTAHVESGAAVGQQMAQLLVADGFVVLIPDLAAQLDAAPQVPLRRRQLAEVDLGHVGEVPQADGDVHLAVLLLTNRDLLLVKRHGAAGLAGHGVAIR